MTICICVCVCVYVTCDNSEASPFGWPGTAWNPRMAGDLSEYDPALDDGGALQPTSFGNEEAVMKYFATLRCSQL